MKVLLLVMTLAVMALAIPPKDEGGDRKPKKMYQSLNLSSETQKSVEAIHQKYRVKTKIMRTELNALQKKERKLFNSVDFKVAELKAVIKKVGTIRTNIHLTKVDQENEIKKVLSPEQWKKLQSEKKDKKRRPGKRKSKGASTENGIKKGWK